MTVSMRLRMTFAFVVLAAAALGAQSFRGGIVGTVTDSSGASVADAQVTVTSEDTGLTRVVETDSDGNYHFSELPLGNYSVTVVKTGFNTQTQKGIAVAVSTDSRVDFKMTPGEVKQVVEVNSEVPLVDTTSDTVGGTIEGSVVQDLPVNGRDFTKLMTLVPGATADPGSVSESPGSFGLFSINGNRGRSDNYLLDGTDMNDGFRNDPAINEGGVFGVPATLLPVDAVAEFGILAGTEAEYGRNAGAIVNIVTKSGTNSLHGSAFEDFRNNHLDARNYFNCASNPCALNTSPQRANIFLNNQFGGSLGGPIVKDKTFFFAAYEGQREKVDFPSIITVPTQNQLNTFLAVPGNAINPVISNLLALNPWTKPAALPVGDAAGDSVNLGSVLEGTNRLDSVITKIDQHIGMNDVFTGRYFFGDSNQTFPLGLSSGSNVPGYNTHVPTRVQVVSLSYTHVFTNKLLMEVRGGWNRFAETFTPQDSNFNPGSIGLDTNPSGNPVLFGLPTISVGGYSSLGNGTSQPRGRVDTNWQYFTNFSYNTGKHNLKMGFEFRRTSINSFLDGKFRGTLSFNSLVDFLNGQVDGGAQATGDTHRLTHQNSQGLYLQDNYRLTRKLTFNYGLRWDHYGVITEKHNRFSIFNTTTDSLQLVGTSGLGQLYPDDWKNISPRASVAYDIFGKSKTILRGGWGLYYDAYSQDFFLDQSVNNAGNLGPAYNGIGPSPVETGGVVTPVLKVGVPVYGGFAPGAAVFTVDQGLKTPYMEEYNLNVEQQISSGLAMQIGYVGSQGHRLFRFRDLNQTNPALPSPGTPFPGFGVINQFESNAFSKYNSLQAGLNFRGYHGLTSSVNYNWSHSIDNASDGFDFVPQATQPDNSRRPDLERANSNFDVRQRFSWNFDYKLPGSSWMPKATSGWSIGGIATLMTGTPVNLITFGGQPGNSSADFNGSNEFLGRPDIIGNPLQGQHLPEAYLNLSNLAVPCILNAASGGTCIAGTQHFGSAGRNAFTGPHFRNLDLAISKSTPLGEHVKMEFRADFFNIFNHPNFTNPVLPNFFIDYLTNGLTTTQIGPGQFRGTGTGFLPITATPDVGSANPFLGGGGPRNIQLSVRFSF
jgi:hypothetical protein